jgi:hemolysin III
MALTETLTRPRLRGRFHQVAFYLAVPAVVALIVAASGAKATVAAVIYAVGLCALYGVSSAYHRGRWSPTGQRRMKRLDHGTIFVMIAGTYTPICLVVLRGAPGIVLLVLVWATALTGMALALAGLAERRYIGFALYLGLGWVVAVAFPQLVQRLDPGVIVLLIVGGILYTVGAAVLGIRWPDPLPATLGYHEVWHAMVIVASVCHFLVVFNVLRSPA